MTQVAAALAVLTRLNIPPDVQELLVYGNPACNVAPGALAKALAAAPEGRVMSEQETAMRIDKMLAHAERNGWNAAINAARRILPVVYSQRIRALYKTAEEQPIAEKRSET